MQTKGFLIRIDEVSFTDGQMKDMAMDFCYHAIVLNRDDKDDIADALENVKQILLNWQPAKKKFMDGTKNHAKNKSKV